MIRTLRFFPLVAVIILTANISGARAQDAGTAAVPGASFTTTGTSRSAAGKLVKSCLADALAKDTAGTLSGKLRDFLRIQSEITLHKIARFQLLQMRSTQSPEVYDVEATILTYLREKNAMAHAEDWTALQSLRHQRAFIVRATELFPDLLGAGSAATSDGDAYRFDADDLMLLGLHASEESKWQAAGDEPGMSRDPQRIQSILDFARTVNRSFRARNVAGMSADERSREIEAMRSVIDRLSNDLQLKGTDLLNSAHCPIAADCTDCRSGDGKLAVGGLLAALREEQDRKEGAKLFPALRVDQLLSRYGQSALRFLPAGPEVIVDPPTPPPPATGKSFLPDPFKSRYRAPAAAVPPAPYAVTADANRTTVLRAYAEGIPDGTTCDHFGVVDKVSGRFEVFAKSNLETPETVYPALTGSLSSDEDTRWVDITKGDGSDTTPAGSFIIDRYPKGRRIESIFGDQASLVYNDAVRADARQGRLSETNVMTVHAIPEPSNLMKASESAARKRAVADLRAGRKPGTPFRRTNGCVNLDAMDYSQMMGILGHQCRMYILPEVKGDAFVIGSDRRLTLVIGKPKIGRVSHEALTDAEIEAHYHATRVPAPTPDIAIQMRLPEEADLLRGIPRENLSPDQSELLAHLRSNAPVIQANARSFAETLASTDLKSSLGVKHSLTREDYGTLSKLAYAIYGEEYLYGAGGRNEAQFPKSASSKSVIGSVGAKGWSEALRCELVTRMDSCPAASTNAESPFRTLFRTYNDTLAGREILFEKRGKVEVLSSARTGTAPDDTAVILMSYLGQTLSDVRADNAKPADPLRSIVSRLWGKDAGAAFTPEEERKYAALRTRMDELDLNEVAPRLQIIPKQDPHDRKPAAGSTSSPN